MDHIHRVERRLRRIELFCEPQRRDLIDPNPPRQRIVRRDLLERAFQLIDRLRQRRDPIVAPRRVAERLVAVRSRQLIAHVVLQRRQFVRRQCTRRRLATALRNQFDQFLVELLQQPRRFARGLPRRSERRLRFDCHLPFLPRQFRQRQHRERILHAHQQHARIVLMLPHKPRRRVPRLASQFRPRVRRRLHRVLGVQPHQLDRHLPHFLGRQLRFAQPPLTKMFRQQIQPPLPQSVEQPSITVVRRNVVTQLASQAQDDEPRRAQRLTIHEFDFCATTFTVAGLYFVAASDAANCTFSKRLNMPLVRN